MTHRHHYLNTPTITSLCQHPLFCLQKHSGSVNEYQGVLLFLHGKIWCHNFASFTFPCQMPFCLLPTVMQQQNVMEYWWEGSVSTAIPSPSASDTMGQHNKTGGFTFRTTLIHTHIQCWNRAREVPLSGATSISSAKVSKWARRIRGCHDRIKS